MPSIRQASTLMRSRRSSAWVVSFRSFEHKEAALELNSIIVCGLKVFLGNAQFCTVLVKIYKCPTELPDTVVIGRLSRFGQVLSAATGLVTSFRIGDVITSHAPCILLASLSSCAHFPAAYLSPLW